MRINGRPATPAQGRRAGTIFVVVGLLTVLVMAGTALLVHLLGPDRGDWPTTPGVVTSNEGSVDVEFDTPGTDYENQRIVTYTVDGQEYSAAMGYSRTQEFPLGEQVAVSYDPEDPAEAELEGETTRVLLLVGGIGGAIGLLFAGIGLAMRRSTRAG